LSHPRGDVATQVSLELIIIRSTILNDVVLPHKNETTIVGYYYFDFREKDSQKPEICLGALISQICTQLGSIPSVVEKSWNNHVTSSGQRRPANFDELRSLFSEVLNHCSKLFLVIDALDECISKEREKLLNFFPCLPVQPTPVHVLVTSRPEGDISKIFLSQQQVKIQEVKVDDHAISGDVLSYLKNVMVQNSMLSGLKPELKDLIVSELAVNCNGMSVIAHT
jgi:hypothetical protein